jgi:cell division protein FtsI (penicillin-binding protein 3)
MFDSAYSIAGKTGTAVSALNNKGYNKGNKIYQASFIGYFPAESPKYSIAVVIQNSRKSKMIYGADVSGKVFKEVSDKIYNHFLSKPNGKENSKIDTSLYSYIGLKNDAQKIFNTIGITYRDSVISSSSSIWRSINYKNNYAGLTEPAQISTVSNITPNVTGMGLKDAVYLLENKGLTTVVTGKGKVYSQSLTPGSNFSKGQKILLMLN